MQFNESKDIKSDADWNLLIMFRALQDGEDAGERRAEVDVPHLLPGHHHAPRRQVAPPEGADRDTPLRQGKQS